MTDGRRTDRGAASPTSRHSARYRAREVTGDARLTSEVFPRNGPPLIAALTPWLGSRRGRVLEIGCGTGQHAAAFDLAFDAIEWWASDLDPLHRASAEAWRAHLRLPERSALAVDAAADWADELGELAPFEAVFSANVIHISPSAVMHGIVAGAAKALAPSGLLIFYGPFNENGEHTGPGNAAFDAGLRSENPDWGLRDVSELRSRASRAGLGLAALQVMPADNRLVIFRKT